MTPAQDQTNHHYAQRYAARGWHVFPLHEARGGTCTCYLGAACRQPGKHPRTPRGHLNASSDPAQIAEWWRRWPAANIGVACGPSRIVVVDVDPRNDGDASLSRLEAEHGELPDTPRVVTGGGGAHYIYAAPDVPRVRCGTIAGGVDVKAEGGYIVAAPSDHASGGHYRWDAGSPDTIAPCPAWVARAAGSPSPPQPSGGAVRDGVLGAAFAALGWLGRDLGPDKAAAQCPWEAEHTGGQRYDGSTVVFAPRAGSTLGWFHCSHSHCASRRLRDVLEQIPADVRERCALPAPEGEPVGDDSGEPDWRNSLRYNEQGRLTKDPGNAALILTHSDEWAGTLEYDAFADRVRWSRPVPHVEGIAPPSPGDELRDHHATYVQHWFARRRGVTMATQAIHDACQLAARSQSSHPVREYLEQLQWDGRMRLATWLSDYLGAARTTYTESVGRWWLVSAVARVMRPGCQADHMLVLEAGQGAGKSTAVRILGGDWYLGQLPDLRSTDASAALCGYWVAEIGELDAVRGAAATRVKDYLSRTIDVYRPPYGRSTVRRPRQTVFVGTTNETHYLQDATGARRFWPVRCGRVDPDALSRDRDQLWAEAYARYDSGEPWWPEPGGDVADAIAIEQDDRHDVDAWEDRVAEWVHGRDEVTTDDILGTCLALEPGRWGRAEQTRVGGILRRLGWEAHRPWSTSGPRKRVYRPAGMRPTDQRSTNLRPTRMDGES